MPNARRKVPVLSPAGLDLYYRELGDSTATYDDGADETSTPAGQVSTPVRLKKVRRKPLLRDVKAEKTAKLERELLERRHTKARSELSTLAFEAARAQSRETTAQEHLMSIQSEYFATRRGGMPADDELVVEIKEQRALAKVKADTAADKLAQLEEAVSALKAKMLRIEQAIDNIDKPSLAGTGPANPGTEQRPPSSTSCTSTIAPDVQDFDDDDDE